MVHRRAKLTPLGRFELVMRVVRDGWPVARVAEGSVVSRQTVHTWVRRYRAEGVPGLEDRSSRPKYSPRRSVQSKRAASWQRAGAGGGDQIGLGRHCDYRAQLCTPCWHATTVRG